MATMKCVPIAATENPGVFDKIYFEIEMQIKIAQASTSNLLSEIKGGAVPYSIVLYVYANSSQ